MNILFKNKTTYNIKEYKKFVEFHNHKYGFKYNAYTIFMFFLFIFCMILQFKYGNIGYGLLFACLGFIFILFRIFYPLLFIKKEASSNKVQKELTNTYFFYNNYMEIKNIHGTIKLNYYKLYKAFESEDNFYLYVNKNYSYVVSKKGFTIGNPDDFYKFIKRKLWYRLD